MELSKLSLSVRILLAMILACIIVILGTTLYCNMAGSGGEPSPYPAGVYTRGAVVSNSLPCAQVGRRILEKYGSAVDAAIATMVCDGVGCIQNMGLGGGFLMTAYTRATGEVVTLNAREEAPAAATEDMFTHHPEKSQFGGLSVGVPGELRGYEAAYKRLGGKAPWRELFEDTIRLCREGFPVDDHMVGSLTDNLDRIRADPLLSSIFLKGGELPRVGDVYLLPRLAATLEQIAESGGADILYVGSLARDLARDIQEAGGIITEADLANYEPRWETPVSVGLSGGLRLFSSPPPGSGLVLGLIMRLLDGLIPSQDALTDTQRITEAFKFAFARRTELGDPFFADVSQVERDLKSDEYIAAIRKKMWDNATHEDNAWYGGQFLNPDDHGTANVVVVAPNGDTVVATSTINLVFGSMVMSKSTGILLNDEMDDFSSPSGVNYFELKPSKANLIAPGKRPLSSMCPAIVLSPSGDVRLAVGAAGGSKITSAVSLVSIRNLWYNETIKEAIDAPRFHHQLFPMKWMYEASTPKELIQGMAKKGHTVEEVKHWITMTTAVADDPIEGITPGKDERRPGGIAVV